MLHPTLSVQAAATSLADATFVWDALSGNTPVPVSAKSADTESVAVVAMSEPAQAHLEGGVQMPIEFLKVLAGEAEGRKVAVHQILVELAIRGAECRRLHKEASR